MELKEKLKQPFYWLNKDSRTFLSRGYVNKGTTAEERLREICMTAEHRLGIEGFADRFYSYLEKGWISLSTPIWCNFGNNKGSSISCFGSWMPDSVDGIIETQSEIRKMSTIGGGTSFYAGAVRGRGTPIRNKGVSDGTIGFAADIESGTNHYKQGESRRGSCAGYIPMEHPDIEEWLQIQRDGNPLQELFYGVCITDEFMEDIVNGKSRRKQELWAKFLESRMRTGIGYAFFHDTVNRNTVDVYIDKNMTIHASNLCSEIALPSSEDESFICCLASVNLLHYDDWKETRLVQDVTYFLDANITEFINQNKHVKYMERAVRFAERHRAIGLGVLGWHSFLQSKMIPFESFEAMMLNAEIFKLIKEKSYEASAELAKKFGEPEILKGYGRRNTTLNSVAPTMSSSFILGNVSPSIEPYLANIYTKKLAKINVLVRNPFLEDLLEKKGKNTAEVWDDINNRGGSVQHLDFLSTHEKNVFKTFPEINQMVVIQQAAQRQQFIDQAQSLNLMIHPETSSKDISDLHIEAWRLGVKTLYYLKTINKAQEFNRSLYTDCIMCEA